MRFNMEPDHDQLRLYLKETQPYDHIHLNLLSQGLWSPGVVPVQRWHDLAASAAKVHGEVISVDQDAYPLDTGSTMRFQPAFAALPPRHPLPAPLTMADMDTFLDTRPPPIRLLGNNAEPSGLRHTIPDDDIPETRSISVVPRSLPLWR